MSRSIFTFPVLIYNSMKYVLFCVFSVVAVVASAQTSVDEMKLIDKSMPKDLPGAGDSVMLSFGYYYKIERTGEILGHTMYYGNVYRDGKHIGQCVVSKDGRQVNAYTIPNKQSLPGAWQEYHRMMRNAGQTENLRVMQMMANVMADTDYFMGAK